MVLQYQNHDYDNPQSCTCPTLVTHFKHIVGLSCLSKLTSGLPRCNLCILPKRKKAPAQFSSTDSHWIGLNDDQRSIEQSATQIHTNNDNATHFSYRCRRLCRAQNRLLRSLVVYLCIGIIAKIIFLAMHGKHSLQHPPENQLEHSKTQQNESIEKNNRCLVV